jgi:glycosyltransferase involved in cell wall biosynthesis
MAIKNLKLSFLIAAHNEEKVIEQTLKNLSSLPYNNYEVIIGLDACTDNTENIVNKFKRLKPSIFKYYKLNLRQGKTSVINNIIKHAEGDIIIINDADWIFSYTDKEKLTKFLSVFNNPKIGGIAEHFPVEWDAKKLKNSNLGFKMVAYSSYYWFKYQKHRFSYQKDNLIYLKEPTMSLTNIFRRKLYKENLTLGDDFERTAHIMQKAYDVVLFDNIEMPRMIAVYDKIKIKDLIKQKIRNAIARRQISEVIKAPINTKSYYLPAILFMLRKSFRDRISAFFIVLFWIFITTYAVAIAKFTRKSTSEGWRMRARS